MGLFRNINLVPEWKLKRNELRLLQSLASSSVYVPVVDNENIVSGSNTLNDALNRYRDFIEEEPIIEQPISRVIEADGEPIKDAFYYLLQVDLENNNLHTPGNELFFTDSSQEYTGYWHTRIVNGVLTPFTGQSSVMSTNENNQPKELRLKPLPEDIQNYFRLTNSLFELKAFADVKPMSDFVTNDAIISINVNDESSKPPYTTKWFRTDENNNTVELREFENRLTANNLTYGVYIVEVMDSSFIIPEGTEGETVSGSNGQADGLTQISTPYTTKIIVPIYQPEPTLAAAERNNIEEEVFRRLQEQFSDTNEDISAVSYRLTQRTNTLNEEAIIQRILDGTDLDERLYNEYVAIENARMGIIEQPPATPDALRVSNLDEDINEAVLNERILNRLMNNLPTFNDLLNQADSQNALRTMGLLDDKPINSNYNRNRLGFITSDESVEEGLIDVELVDKMVRSETFSNIVDVDFEQLKSESAIQSEIEDLEENIKLLEQDLLDLQSSADGLINDRVTQENEINTKEQTIVTLELQLEELRNRFAVTPAEGTIFRIPVETVTPKEKIDFWLIENGQRRRVRTYTMVQVLLSTVDKTINDIQILQPTQIAQIEQGPDLLPNEFKNPHTQGGINSLLYVPDEYLRNGKVVTDLYSKFDPLYPEVTYEEVIAEAYRIAVVDPANGFKHHVLPNLSTDELWCTPDLEVRFAVMQHAIWNIQSRKVKILKAKENLEARLAEKKRIQFAQDNRDYFLVLLYYTANYWLSFKNLYESNPNTPNRNAMLNAIYIQLNQIKTAIQKAERPTYNSSVLGETYQNVPFTFHDKLLFQKMITEHNNITTYISGLSPNLHPLFGRILNGNQYQHAIQVLANIFNEGGNWN